MDTQQLKNKIKNLRRSKLRMKQKLNKIIDELKKKITNLNGKRVGT